MLNTIDADNPPARALAGPEISVVIPTFNESGNIAELVRRIAETLAGVAWEVIVVDDDSADGTADIVDAIARRDHRVRCIRRIGRRCFRGSGFSKKASVITAKNSAGLVAPYASRSVS